MTFSGMITVDSSHEFTTRRPEKQIPQPAMPARRQNNNNRNGAQQNYGARPPGQGGFNNRLPIPVQVGMQGMGQGNPYQQQQQQQQAYVQYNQQHSNQPPYQIQPGQQNSFGQIPIRPTHQQSNGYQNHTLPNPYAKPQHIGNPAINPASGYPFGPPPHIPMHDPGHSLSSNNLPAPPFPLAPSHNKTLHGGLPTRPVPTPGFALAPSGPSSMTGGGNRMNGNGNYQSGGYGNGSHDSSRENGGLKRGPPGLAESIPKRSRQTEGM